MERKFTKEEILGMSLWDFVKEHRSLFSQAGRFEGSGLASYKVIEVCELTPAKISHFRNLGKKSANELDNALSYYDLHFATKYTFKSDEEIYQDAMMKMTPILEELVRNTIKSIRRETTYHKA